MQLACNLCVAAAACCQLPSGFINICFSLSLTAKYSRFHPRRCLRLAANLTLPAIHKNLARQLIQLLADFAWIPPTPPPPSPIRCFLVFYCPCVVCVAWVPPPIPTTTTTAAVTPATTRLVSFMQTMLLLLLLLFFLLLHGYFFLL